MRLGYRLDFDGEILPRLPRKVRHTIAKANEELYVREGFLDELRVLHFDSTYLPSHIGADSHVFVAVLDDSLPAISAVLVEEHGDHIYYKYSGNDAKFKSYQGNSFLLWWIAESYKLKGYRYFDLGGSAIPSIERFKRGFGTSSYPLEKRCWFMVLFAKARYHIKKVLRHGF